jgi:hypothetical protein
VGEAPPHRFNHRYDPGALASVTSSCVVGVSVTVRSNPATFWLKSDGLATTTPLMAMVADDTRLLPSASPFWTCSVNGLATVDGTVTVTWNSSFGPVVRVNFCGPQNVVQVAAVVRAFGVAVARGRAVAVGLG